MEYSDIRTPIRCPICLTRQLVYLPKRNWWVIKCVSCKRSSESYSWLNSNIFSSDKDKENLPINNEHEKQTLIFKKNIFDKTIINITFIIIIYWFVNFLFFDKMQGQIFMLYYVIILLLTFLASFIVRYTFSDDKAWSFIGLISFEGLGIIRLITGIIKGMHIFQNLFIVMYVGFILFIMQITASSTTGGYSGGSCGGGGCGGGGCGGGGCGGCGG